MDASYATWLDNRLKSYPAYISHLQNESHTNAKAESLAKILGNYQVMVFGTLLKEILHPLVKLSLCLQRSDVTLADIQIMTEATVTMLNSLKDHKSEALLMIEEKKELSGVALKIQGKQHAMYESANYQNHTSY